MPYNLSDKITKYLTDHGVPSASIVDMVVSIALPNGGEMHRKINGLVTEAKLAAIVEEYKEYAAESASV